MKLSLKKLLSKMLDESVYKPGDTYTLTAHIKTGGYVTTSSTQVCFSIPLDRAVSPDVTSITVSNLQLTVRQNGKYAYGSSGASGVAPKSMNASWTRGFLTLTCTMQTTTNATNNDAAGISTTESNVYPTISFN